MFIGSPYNFAAGGGGGGGTPTNYADTANGGSITATVAALASTNLDSVINGNRRCPNWGGGSGTVAGNGYHSASTVSGFINFDVDFGATRSITEIDIFFVPLPENDTSTPTLTQTSDYAIRSFEIFYWNGSSWISIQSVTGNDKVWRQFTFSTISTTKIRLQATSGGLTYGYALLAEIEAWS
ncbi:MAG TPA: discoidin domain-containing protein [Pyrinomonadaceae bacterium]|jgi:hypothetical protein